MLMALDLNSTFSYSLMSALEGEANSEFTGALNSGKIDLTEDTKEKSEKKMTERAPVNTTSEDNGDSSGSSFSKRSIEDEREDGFSQAENSVQKDKKLNHDEDKRNPQYVPKKGTFYEHDDRTMVDGSEAEGKKTKMNKKDVVEEVAEADGAKKTGGKVRSTCLWTKKTEKWSHDLYNDDEQKPKSSQELIDTYGYDIRNEESPPKARRCRKHGQGPNKYNRTWEDKEAYTRGAPHRRVFRNNKEEFPDLGTRGRDRDRMQNTIPENSNKSQPRNDSPRVKSKSPAPRPFPAQGKPQIGERPRDRSKGERGRGVKESPPSTTPSNVLPSPPVVTDKVGVGGGVGEKVVGRGRGFRGTGKPRPTMEITASRGRGPLPPAFNREPTKNQADDRLKHAAEMLVQDFSHPNNTNNIVEETIVPSSERRDGGGAGGSCSKRYSMQCQRSLPETTSLPARSLSETTTPPPAYSPPHNIPNYTQPPFTTDDRLKHAAEMLVQDFSHPNNTNNIVEETIVPSSERRDGGGAGGSCSKRYSMQCQRSLPETTSLPARSLSETTTPPPAYSPPHNIPNYTQPPFTTDDRLKHAAEMLVQDFSHPNNTNNIVEETIVPSSERRDGGGAGGSCSKRYSMQCQRSLPETTSLPARSLSETTTPPPACSPPHNIPNYTQPPFTTDDRLKHAAEMLVQDFSHPNNTNNIVEETIVPSSERRDGGGAGGSCSKRYSMQCQRSLPETTSLPARSLSETTTPPPAYSPPHNIPNYTQPPFTTDDRLKHAAEMLVQDFSHPNNTNNIVEETIVPSSERRDGGGAGGSCSKRYSMQCQRSLPETTSLPARSLSETTTPPPACSPPHNIPNYTQPPFTTDDRLKHAAEMLVQDFSHPNNTNNIVEETIVPSSERRDGGGAGGSCSKRYSMQCQRSLPETTSLPARSLSETTTPPPACSPPHNIPNYTQPPFTSYVPTPVYNDMTGPQVPLMAFLPQGPPPAAPAIPPFLPYPPLLNYMPPPAFPPFALQQEGFAPQGPPPAWSADPPYPPVLNDMPQPVFSPLALQPPQIPGQFEDPWGAEMYQGGGGITYYSLESQSVVPRSNPPPQRRNLAIPIVPPPDNEKPQAGAEQQGTSNGGPDTI